MEKLLHEIDKGDRAFVIDQGQSSGYRSAVVVKDFGAGSISIVQDADTIVISGDRVAQLIKALKALTK